MNTWNMELVGDVRMFTQNRWTVATRGLKDSPAQTGEVDQKSGTQRHVQGTVSVWLPICKPVSPGTRF